ncbi:MAG: hypothetical protein U0L11_05750 [Acutalibacteraceae bacterium]|nr:hypothetical protein [Acutalibacteraceae bacterium]
MICPVCGAQVNGEFDFCTNCGNALPKNQEQAQTYATENTDYGNVNIEANEINAKAYISGVKPGFILGIVSLSLAIATNYIAAGLPAIVCGIISLIKLKGLPAVMPEYIMDPVLLTEYQAAAKKANLSKKLSIAGIIVAIAIDVFYALVGLIIVFATFGIPAIAMIIAEL